eukprot:CAMPEP_0174928298 /NCGR_PEP_ID=MMETSP1355-20121228/22842_1 /TAXON_ID=464990 /ORGANISM="Hemiselmis tepida, Strain CCMP443" /LENGTH=369 /DNA_ID=CAMNT_0016174451 /DNA_START=118 /DNA_END=1223 /DNA_ORIENTATION=-
MSLRKVAVMGSGKIGRACAFFLQKSGSYEVTSLDNQATNLRWIDDHVPGAKTRQVSFEDANAMARALDGHEAVLAAGPFWHNPLIAEVCKKVGSHYLDLTEDVSVTSRIKDLAEGASTAFVPQCGLAPGFITIAGYNLARSFDKAHELRLRVGALPRFPSNALKYNLTWSTSGLINEYIQPCEAIVGGQLVSVPPLEHLERCTIEGLELESFNTSGGLGTLADTLRGQISSLDYKTLRFPGHRDILKLLLHDLGYAKDPEGLGRVLERSIPATDQDQVAVFVSCTGEKGGRLLEKTYAKIIRHREIGGLPWTAIQITTAGGACCVLDLLLGGKLPSKGLVRNEEVAWNDFITNRFGSFYASDVDAADQG